MKSVFFNSAIHLFGLFSLFAGCSSDTETTPDSLPAIGSVESEIRDRGTYFTNIACPSPCQMQMRYQNTGDWHHYTRADGYAVYLGSGNGYIRKVELYEYTASTQRGFREVNYTGSATSATMLDIPTTYLPLMLNDSYNAQAFLKATTSTGKVFSGIVGIGN